MHVDLERIKKKTKFAFNKYTLMNTWTVCAILNGLQ